MLSDISLSGEGLMKWKLGILGAVYACPVDLHKGVLAGLLTCEGPPRPAPPAHRTTATHACKLRIYTRFKI